MIWYIQINKSMATVFHNILTLHVERLKDTDETKVHMEKYTFIREIGSGSFGKVFLVKSKQQGIHYVVKKIDLSKLDRKESQSASKEVEFLAKLRHNNIVSYKESYEKNNELNIVLEYCENGDLHNKIKEKRISGKFFAENEIFDYFVQISLALEYIHSQKILHRDLKTKNIFLTKGNVIKLGDFGIARTLENSFELAQTCIGSPFYLSPEICESKPYNKKSDVWALGCVLYELATLKYAFVAKNVKILVTKILAGAYSPLPTNMNVHIRSLISCMLKPNPTDRPSVREILEKRFLIKRRATFICKAYRNDFYKKRSRSGDTRNFSCGITKNETQKNSVNMRKHSVSCLQLNQHHINEQKKFNGISNPKTKYNPLNNCRGLRNDKKIISVVQKNLNSIEKQEDSKSEAKNISCYAKKFKNEQESEILNLENLKTVKLFKVESEYYDLIAGQDGKESPNEKKDDIVGKQIPCDEFSLIKIKPDTRKMRKILKSSPHTAEEIEESGDLLQTDFKLEKFQGKEQCRKGSTGQEHRKKWSKNTLQREALLAVFNESELLDGSFPSGPLDGELGNSIPCKTVDDMLSINPSEITEEVLQPVQLYESESRKKYEKNNYLQLLQHEVEHLREKFELNNRNYQIEDLMRLTDNSKNILKLESIQKYTGEDKPRAGKVGYSHMRGINRISEFSEYGKKIGESVYHDLECLRMTLEQKIGFCNFSQAYGKMINIINDELDSALKNSLEKHADLTKTYVIKKNNVAGDNDDLIKNTWKSIIGILGDKQEYLPDVWELAMSENIYYHL